MRTNFQLTSDQISAIFICHNVPGECKPLFDRPFLKVPCVPHENTKKIARKYQENFFINKLGFTIFKFLIL